MQTAAGVSGTVALELAGTTNILIVRSIHCKIIKSRLTQQRDKDGEDQGELEIRRRSSLLFLFNISRSWRRPAFLPSRKVSIAPCFHLPSE